MNDELVTKTEFRAGLAELEAKIDARFDAMQELMRDMQTELLRGFAAFVESNQISVRRLENNEVALNSRMPIVETRLFEIEKRLIMHPPKA